VLLSTDIFSLVKVKDTNMLEAVDPVQLQEELNEALVFNVRKILFRILE
jgi:hypothetical protein